MFRKALSLVVLLPSLLAAPGAALAQTTFEDPQGRFVIDLPEGWRLTPQTDDKVLVFQGEGKSIIIECVPMMKDPAELLRKAETTLRAAGFANPVLDADVLEMTLNGLPAHWGIYKSAPSGAPLAALCGGVVNGDNGFYFLSIIPAAELATWKDRLQRTFHTIRGQGQKATGVENVKAVPAATSAPAGTRTPWSNALVSLTLPPGWGEKPKPRGIEKEVQGLFVNNRFPGATILAICYKGIGMNTSKALEGGLKTITLSMPDAKPVDVQEMEVEGKKIYFTVFKGTAVGAGTVVDLGAILAVTKADNGHMALIAIAMYGLVPELRNQVLEIARTVK
jgi:hypothetical protein